MTWYFFFTIGILFTFFIFLKYEKDLCFENKKRLLFFTYIFSLLGGFLWHFFEFGFFYEENWYLGLTFYGGFLGFMVGFFISLKLTHEKISKIAPLALPYLFILASIARLGCHFNGCCYGKEFHSFFSTTSHILNDHIPRIPTQLEESLFFLLMSFFSFKFKKYGLKFTFLALFAVGFHRFLSEFLRADDKIFWGSFSVYQWTSLNLMVLGILGFFMNYLKILKKWLKKTLNP